MLLRDAADGEQTEAAYMCKKCVSPGRRTGPVGACERSEQFIQVQSLRYLVPQAHQNIMLCIGYTYSPSAKDHFLCICASNLASSRAGARGSGSHKVKGTDVLFSK